MQQMWKNKYAIFGINAQIQKNSKLIFFLHGKEGKNTAEKSRKQDGRESPFF